MFYVQDGMSYWTWPYFIIIIIIGSFVLLNLTLAVIKVKFSESENNLKGEFLKVLIYKIILNLGKKIK